MQRFPNNSISLFHVSISSSHSLPHFLSLYIHTVFLLVWPLSTLFSYLPPYSPPAFQWPCTPSVQSILPVWWCVWCWHWLQWCACCRRLLSPVSLSITWEMTLKGRSPPLKTAAMRMTRGILGIFMTRSRQDRVIKLIYTVLMSLRKSPLLSECLHFDCEMA